MFARLESFETDETGFVNNINVSVVEGDGAGGFQVVEGHHVGALGHIDTLHGALAEDGVGHALARGELRRGGLLGQPQIGGGFCPRGPGRGTPAAWGCAAAA